MKKEKVTKVSIFDLLKFITANKKPYTLLSAEEKKEWSTYMVNRFLSMNIDLIEVINDLQKYTMYMDNKDVYRLYLEILPSTSIFFKYIKKSKEGKYNKELVEVIRNYFLCSSIEAIEYIDLYMDAIDKGRTEIKDILSRTGHSEKQIQKLI